MEPIEFVISAFPVRIKGEIKSDQDFIVIKTPNIILGFLSYGENLVKIPVDHISYVSVNERINFKNLIAGIVLCIFCFLNLNHLTFWYIVISVILLFAAFGSIFEFTLNIATTSGKVETRFFSIFEKEKLNFAEEQINGIISCRLADTNVRERVK